MMRALTITTVVATLVLTLTQPAMAKKHHHHQSETSKEIPKETAVASLDTSGALDEYVPGAQATADLQSARDYLVATVAEPGGTMRRQGVRNSIERLHPQFAVRLAAAVRESREAGIRVFVFSAYRPPALGVGGYKNKYDSAHTYGLAADMEIPGGACSKNARRWYEIAHHNGLYLPYGWCNRAEYNHTQLMPSHGHQFVADHQRMRQAVRGNGPISALAMWVYSGIKCFVASVEVRVQVTEAHVADRRRSYRVARAHHHQHLAHRYFHRQRMVRA